MCPSHKFSLSALQFDRLTDADVAPTVSTACPLDPEPVGPRMTYWQYQLYERLEAFVFDRPDADLPFSERLARDNLWTEEVALAVCEEYRRFLFLACTADHIVTPSAAVDEAWHLHLNYTKSYWIVLCDGVLGRPLHHVPTEGRAQELAHHRDCYVRTLESYERYFGRKPPTGIWPDVDSRFRQGNQRLTVDLADYWLVRKPGPWIRSLPMLALGAGLCAASWYDIGRLRMRTPSCHH